MIVIAASVAGGLCFVLGAWFGRKITLSEWRVGALHEAALGHEWEPRAGNMGDTYCRKCGAVRDDNDVFLCQHELVNR